MKNTIIKQGAEAVLTFSKLLGKDVIIKERIVKGYRHILIDSKLRAERLKTEARLFREARRLGISVPIIYDIDIKNNKIIMEFINGRQAKEIINDPKVSKLSKKKLCFEIGRVVNTLHLGNMVHGDLTTSNMIFDGDRIYIIDFSMGAINADLEKKGVDFHLLKEAFQSAHSENIDLFKEVEKGYLRYTGGHEVICKMKEIEERGRYSRNVG